MKSLLEERIADALLRVETRWRPEVTPFLTRPEWKRVEPLLRRSPVDWSFWGGYEDAERGRIAMKMEEGPFAFADYEMTLLALRGRTDFVRVGHRDYLGALMSLGFEREKMGDVIVRDNGCDLFIASELVDYVAHAGLTVRRVPLLAEVLDIERWTPPEPDFKEKTVFVASLRLDAVLAQGFALSRREAAEALQAGEVLLSYVPTESPHATVAEGDVITLRGHGKLRIDGIGGPSKKGRIALTLSIYQ